MTRINQKENPVLHKGSDTFVEAFARGLAVIRAFEGERRGLTLSDIASRAGLPAAGARRLLHTLVTLGYARIENKHFFLTPLMLKLGFTYLSSLSFREVAQPLIDQFAKTAGEVCTLSVLEGDEIVYVVRADVRSPLTRGLSLGDRLPAHATSTGHVLMAGLPASDLDTLLALAPFPRFTPHTLCTREELIRAVDTARRQGWALASEHIELGVCGFAVPVLDEQGRATAALTVSVNLARHTEKEIVERFLRPLQEIALQLHQTASTV